MTIVEMWGDFTMLKYVIDLSRDEIEDKVGFEPGRLDEGATIFVLAPDETMAPDDFELGASSRWSRSSAAAPWAPQYVVDATNGTMTSDAIEHAVLERGRDLAAIKEKVARFFMLQRGNRPAKVKPRDHRPGDLYPDAIGPGIPQFRLLRKKRFVGVRHLVGRSGAV